MGTITQSLAPTMASKNPSSAKNTHWISYTQTEHVWSYVGKMVITSRHLMNAAAKNIHVLAWACKNFPDRIKNLTTQLKLLSIVSVPYSLVDLKGASEKVFKAYQYADKEGIALGMLSVVIITTDIFDSITTFVNSALATASFATVEVFSTLGLPAGFIITGLGTVSRTINIAKAHHLYNKMDRELSVKAAVPNKEQIKAFIESLTGLTEEEKQQLIASKQPSEEIKTMTEKKKTAFLRMAPSESLQEFEILLAQLEKTKEPLTQQQGDAILNSLMKIKAQLKKKMTTDAIGIMANLIGICGLTLLAIGLAGTPAYLLLATAYLSRIAMLLYQDLIK